MGGSTTKAGADAASSLHNQGSSVILQQQITAARQTYTMDPSAPSPELLGKLTAENKFFFEDKKDKFEEVKERWVTDQLYNLDPLPAAILDIGKVRVNCQRMLDATRRLGLLWRPHVKTHKVSPVCSRWWAPIQTL